MDNYVFSGPTIGYPQRPIVVMVSALLAVCFSCVPAVRADTLDEIRSSGAITIAYRETSLPFSYLDADGKPIGYAIDLCLDIAGAIKRKLKMQQLRIQWVPVTSANRIPTIVSGKADLECGSTTNTAERRKQVDFTIPHFISSARFIVKSNSGITQIDDLKGKTVVSTKGTTNIRYLREKDGERGLNLKILEANDHAEAFGMVVSGKADAFEMDDILLYGFRANAKNPKDYSVVGKFLSIEPYAIMMKKDNPAFKRIVDDEMIRLINDYEIYSIYSKWFEKPIPPKNINLAVAMPFLLKDSFKYPSEKVGDQ